MGLKRVVRLPRLVPLVPLWDAFWTLLAGRRRMRDFVKIIEERVVAFPMCFLLVLVVLVVLVKVI